ncbi:hypothetical protein R1sor_006986 [Riccia sorocarpa]|uniref:Uncharacterized protein n=1 Tax=Riccia sorocarpa TaxID=122646 RepID=A0ABD3HTD5_9MARC
MVYVLPWDPRFNPNEIRTRSVPIWVGNVAQAREPASGPLSFLTAKHEQSRGAAVEHQSSGPIQNQLTKGDANQDAAMNVEGTGAEGFTSFDEAERANARPASRLEYDDQIRLSCVGGNRLDFAEGRKKVRNQDDHEDSLVLSTPLQGAADQHSKKPGSSQRSEGQAQTASKQGQKQRNDRGWLQNNPEVGIIGFQELKTGEVRAEWALRSIFREGRVIVDYARDDKGGAALVIHKDFTVKEMW